MTVRSVERETRLLINAGGLLRRVPSGLHRRYTDAVASRSRPAAMPSLSPEQFVHPPRYENRVMIVGAGPQGLHAAIMLVSVAGLDPESLLLVDREPGLLAHWRRVTSATGMRYLRSSSVHHVDVEPPSLRRFRSARADDYPRAYADPYHRPLLRLFDDHARWAAERRGLSGRLRADDIVGIEPLEGGYRLNGRRSRYETDNLVLALGQGRPNRPDWSRAGPPGVPVRHLFDRDYDRREWRAAAADGVPIRVVGAGISALQAALDLSGTAAAAVDVYAVHPPGIFQFDSDPGWIGPKLSGVFARTTDVRERRRIIRTARRPGSADPDTVARFEDARRSGRLRFHRCDPDTLGPDILRSARRSGGRVLLATGFESGVPGGRMVSGLARDAGAPVDADGYPVPGPSLAWRPGLFVTGALAELEIGPPARNIAGARRAAERICRAWVDADRSG